MRADPRDTGPLIYRDCATEDGLGDEGAGRMYGIARTRNERTLAGKSRRRYKMLVAFSHYGSVRFENWV